MKVNTGHADRTIRAFAALVFLAFGIGGLLSGALATVAIIVGVVLGLTALFGFCPMYTVMKKDTLHMGE